VHLSVREKPHVRDAFWRHDSLTGIFKQGESVNPVIKADASKLSSGNHIM
jgi:hypothetical protein